MINETTPLHHHPSCPEVRKFTELTELYMTIITIDPVFDKKFDRRIQDVHVLFYKHVMWKTPLKDKGKVESLVTCSCNIKFEKKMKKESESKK